MLYSTLLVAATAFSGFVAAQNATAPNGPCCTVPANIVPDDDKSDWCRANQNTCPEICGGQGQIASGGNECDADTLEFTCKCRNGTEPALAEYEQTVPGQMCRFWFDQCINATGDNLSQQFICTSTRDERCGNKTTKEASTSASITSSRLPTSTSGSESTATSSGGSTSTSTGAAALALARDFGTPVLAGGLIAFFGIAL